MYPDRESSNGGNHILRNIICSAEVGSKKAEYEHPHPSLLQEGVYEQFLQKYPVRYKNLILPYGKYTVITMVGNRLY